MTVAYLGLGSNKGERINYIESALKEIGKLVDTKILRSSEIYETEPWGVSGQNDYLNSVTEISTELTAADLLRKLKGIEKKLGRKESAKWHEREIDIDLLFYGDLIVENDLMKVPHHQIENRKFVLVPMNEISPDFVHPVFKKKISELLKDTNDKLSVTRYKLINTEK